MEENIQIQPPVNLPIVPIPPKKRFRFFWLIIVGAILVAGIFLLRIAGSYFIQEVVQDISIERSDESNMSKFRNILGQPAPYFELEDINGAKVKVSDFLGKPLVITFWTSWNGEAVDQLRIITAEVQKDKRGIFEAITVNSQEDKSSVSNFVRRGGYDAKILLDVSGAVSDLYQARNLPATYFVDSKGIIREVYVGVLDSKSVVDKVGRLLSR